jgi:hypothetical protein
MKAYEIKRSHPTHRRCPGQRGDRFGNLHLAPTGERDWIRGPRGGRGERRKEVLKLSVAKYEYRETQH